MASRRPSTKGRAPTVPPLPAKTPAEQAASDDLAARMRALADQLRARNLSNAVLLAQQAACGHGPLVQHFNELGRDWGHLLLSRKACGITKGDVVDAFESVVRSRTKAPRAKLRVIEGGAE